jgi:hypothetical protein
MTRGCDIGGDAPQGQSCQLENVRKQQQHKEEQDGVEIYANTVVEIKGFRGA